MTRTSIARFSVLLCTLTLASGQSGIAGTWKVKGQADANRITSNIRAAQFLTHATFGPSHEDIVALSARMQEIGTKPACEEWIDRQFDLPATKHMPLVDDMLLQDNIDPLVFKDRGKRFRQHAFWHIALTADDQLRQRMAWALMQMFVVGDGGQSFNNHLLDTSGRQRWTGMVNYYDMLVENSFDRYRKTLEDVTYSPIMGLYLSHLQNRKPEEAEGRFPDENYAREIMQLFSIGLFELKNDGTFRLDENNELIETYDNETIRNFARIFTGFVYARGNGFNRSKNLHEGMLLFQEEHDDGEKVLLGGRVVEAGQSVELDIHQALNNVADHSNVGPFVARHLIQRFVHSNPSRTYIRRVARKFNNNGQSMRGDFKSVLKAVLLDDEAFKGVEITYDSEAGTVTSRANGTERSRLREPVLRYAAFLRAFRPTSNHHTGRFLIPDMFDTWGQANYKSPSVFNFFSPEYQPPGPVRDLGASTRQPREDLVAPEFQIATSRTINLTANRYRADIRDASADFGLGTAADGRNFNCQIALDFSRAEKAANIRVMLRRLDVLLCHGTLSDESQEIIRAAIKANTDDKTEQARAAVLAVVTSPECVIAE
ncbi:MAG: DUF1800 family protein [Planctomycetaceae bacterium]